MHPAPRGLRVHTLGVTEKLPLPFSVHRLNGVQHSRKQRSPLSNHPADWLAGQPFSEQTASDIICYSLSNDWNTVSGTPAIGKFLPSDRNAVRLAVPDVNEKAADWLNS